jgi:hypothetical protein
MSTPTSHLIDDGYDYQGYIAERPGIHPALRFRYRPALPEEREEVTRHTGRSFILEVTDLLGGKLTAWEIRDRQGKPRPVSGDTLRRVQPELLQAIIGIVLGWRASDPDPQDAGARAEARQDRAASGPPGDAKLMEAEKNSARASG